MNDLAAAVALLTIFRFPRRNPQISPHAFSYYPLVGLLIGVILAVANFALRLVLPDLVAGALVVALWAALTGALHLDGFADACDALFATSTPQRRLEILRDVHLGAFGGVGLILLLITKVAAAASIQAAAPFLLAPILGRWAMVYAAAYPPARREGMAVLFRSGLTRREILIATTLAALAAAALGWPGLAAFAGAFLIATLIARLALTRLGGLTGDVYGMICESVEATTLLIGAAVLK
jgi:adenosylcobinamide-GDP ribazoletransferase